MQNNPSIFIKTKTFILAHKFWSAVVLIVIIFGIYKVAAPKTATGQTEYTLGTVQNGIVISSVSESGQVAASNTLTIEAQASGNITWVGVKPGDHVNAGQAIASIDDTTAKQSIADAEASLAQSQLQFEQDQAQAPINYQTSLNNLANDQITLNNEYNNVYNDLSTTYLDLPNVENGMQDILYGYELNSAKSQANEDVLANMFQNYPSVSQNIKSFETTADSNYTIAQPEYAPAVQAYQQITRSSATSTMESVLTQTIQLTTDTAQSLQSELNFLGNVISTANSYNLHLPTTVTTLQTNARTYLGTVNNDLNALLSEQKTLQNDKSTISNDEQNIAVAQIGNNAQGSNPISLQITQSSLAKQEVDLANQKALLANYTVVAPFDGTISAVTAVVGGSAGNVATIVTDKQIADLSLNEVDVAKIALGDKVTMTFDAISGLTMTGTVAEIDAVGTVSQGVVSYTVQIAFDTQDPAVKPGMSVNADIQTAVHQNTLYIPSSAIKTTGGVSTVQVFIPALNTASSTTSTTGGVTSATPPQSVVVTTGISDNTNTEILSGLTAGQQIVTRTTTATAAKSTAATATTRTTGGAAGGFGGGRALGGL